MLAKGEVNSANVQVSEDGRWWSNPVAKTGVTTDYAMRYHDFRPVQAKYVRISQGAGAKLTAVTEVELYAANLLTFENDAVTWDGAGWVVIGYAGPFVPNKVWMSISLDSTAHGTTVTMNGTTMGTSSARLADVRKFTGLRVLTGAEPVDVGNMEHSYDDVVMTG